MSKFLENSVLTELPENLSDEDFKTLINYRETAYNKGYEDALRAIKVNLDHLVKEIYMIETVTKNGEYDVVNGESACGQFLREEIFGYDYMEN